MALRGLPPAHPSLPAAPQFSGFTQNNASPSYAPGPDSIMHSPTASQYMSPHYAQAYLQHQATINTTQRYAISSTHTPGLFQGSNEFTRYTNGTTVLRSPSFHSQTSSWYKPGDSRCTYRGCTFSGSHKAVETHMMDRHLIYPPGWENRKKEGDWDADPSLKGKAIPIMGTTIVLNTPEMLDAWIAERQRRWPSKDRIVEKRKQLEEALARGQINMAEPELLGSKRRRIETHHHSGNGGCDRPVHDKSRGRGKGKFTNSGWRARGRGGRGGRPIMQSTGSIAGGGSVWLSPVRTVFRGAGASSDCDDSGSDDEVPEVVSSKPPPQLAHHESSSRAEDAVCVSDFEDGEADTLANQFANPHLNKPLRKQPKKPPHNPFASRPILLHNLLLPEVRTTVSNLSQAIRFLVDNDFLKGVELIPGDADKKMIEVIDIKDAARQNTVGKE